MEAIIPKHQLDWINSIKESYSSLKWIFFDINEKIQAYQYNPSRSSYTNLILKSVYIMSPHELLQKDISCIYCTNKKLTCSGWENPRRVESIKTSMYLLQRKYRCKDCNTSINSLKIMENGEWRCNLKAMFPFTVKHNSLIHDDLLHLIVSDAMTRKTFHEIGCSIYISRINEYLRLRDIFVSNYKNNPKSSIFSSFTNTMMPTDIIFSQFDDVNGYNEKEQPTDSFIIKIFTDYVEENKDFLISQLQKIKIPSVVSSDDTFNVLKRTTQLNNVTNQYDNVDGTALHTIMGANGVVLGTINFENQK